MQKQYYEIDQDTGEIFPTEDTVVAMQPGDRIYTKKQIDYCKEQVARKQDRTPFVWILFKYGEELFKDLNLSRANLTRLIYAATFCDNKGFLMSKDELREQMGLNKNRWSEFWNEMVDKGILCEADGMVHINEKYFFKGKGTVDANRTRLFCKYIQNIYESCESANDHQQLSYIFKIIPYVNRKTNIVCANPQEQDKSQIKFLRLGDFCEAVGYGRHNARRMAKELLKIRVNGELAVGFFITDLSEDTWTIIVNPNLYFGGLRNEIFEEQKRLFQLEAHNKAAEKILASDDV